MGLCKKRNYSCIDMAKKIDGELEYWYDGTHTTKKGSKIIAQTIYQDLRKILINNY